MTTNSYNLQSSSRSALLSLVEENITNLVRDAIVVQRHCKRARIHSVNPNDLDSDLLKRRLYADDINIALQWRGSEKLYATGTTGGSLLGSESSKKVDLEEYLKSEMNVSPPNEVGITMHWLAVYGIQPETPHNPVPTKKRKPTAGQSHDAASVGDTDSGTEPLGRKAEPSLVNGDDQQNKSGIHVNQLLPRILSEELQLYFSRITTALEQGGSTPIARRQQDASLSSVATDSGLQELVPFFVDYVCKSLSKHLGNSDHCRTLVRLTHSLLVNPHMHLELHLHQLLPVLFTCIVAKKLSSRKYENHWALRDDAAATLAKACNLFGDEYVTLKAQVLRTLCEATAPADSQGKRQARSTIYGGFVGITLFGPKAIDAFLLPLALEYWKQWEEELDKTNDLETRFEIQMCQQVVLNAVGTYLRTGGGSTRALSTGWEGLEETFSDRLVPMCDEPQDFDLCFI